MFSSINLLLAAFVVFAGFAMATPPACLIGALEAQINPADVKGLCSTYQSQMFGNITNGCSGSASSDAIAIYSATCLAQGLTVSMTSSTASSTKTSTSATATGSAATTAKTTGSATTTGTAASASASTKNDGASTSAQLLLGSILLGLGVTSQYIF